MIIGITGASGFIGRNLSRFLHEKGHHVIALVRSPRFAKDLLDAKIEIRKCDITNCQSLNDAFRGVDILIHLAALFNRPEKSPEDFHKVNVEGTRNALEAALDCKVRRFVHCSTGGVVAGGDHLPFSESSPYSTPSWNVYETTKHLAELTALDFNKQHHLDLVVLRPAQPYGPGDTAKAKFYRLVKKGVIVDPQEVLKHPIYIDDLCQAFEMASTRPEASGEIFNIGAPRPILLHDLITVVARHLRVPYPRIILPVAPLTTAVSFLEAACNKFHLQPPVSRRNLEFFTKSIAFDVRKAVQRLGFTAGTDIHAGVKHTAAWYRATGML
jgi:dihydroflavonol-4-reductase